jgi:hypothetical protein
VLKKCNPLVARTHGKEVSFLEKIRRKTEFLFIQKVSPSSAVIRFGRSNIR